MDNKILFGIMCIIFNSIGVPCFMQGHTKAGVWRIIFCFIPFAGYVISIINTIKGIILGVQVLKMSDEEYNEKKGDLASGIPLK